MEKLWKHLGFAQRKPRDPLKSYGSGRGQLSGEESEKELKSHCCKQLKTSHFINEDEMDSCIPVLVRENIDQLDFRPVISSQEATEEYDDVENYSAEPFELQNEISGRQLYLVSSAEDQDEDIHASKTSHNVPENDTRPAAEYDDPWQLRLGVKLVKRLSPSLENGQFQLLNSLCYVPTSGNAFYDPGSSSVLSSETYDSVNSDQMVRQMYETAFDCRVKRNVEDIDRLANSSVFHMESMHLEHGSYQESESSTSSNSGSSGTTPTRYPRSLPQKYLHGRIRQSLSQCEQPEKRKLFHLRSKASPKPFSKQECEKNPTNGGRRRQEQDRKNMSGGLLPFICKKAIRGHLGVRVLPMELGKPLSNLQEKNSPGIEDLERKISNCDLETSDHFKVVRLQINDDLKSSASLVKDSSRNSDSSVRKELAYSNIAKFQCEEKYTRPPGDYESPLNQCEEKDTRPPGDYEPPWDQCEEKFKMPPDDYESPWDQCKENDTRPPDDYELPWDALSPCSSLDEILSAHYLSSSANVPSFQSCHSFFMGGRKDPSDPSVELRHSCCNESSFSKSITDVNQQSDISNTRSLVDYCLPWDLRKHVDQPQPFASLSHSDKTGEQDPIIPIDSSDFNSPSLSDLRNFHQCKASQSHSDKAYSPNEKKIGFSKSTLSVKKNINLPSTLSSESYLQTELVPSTNRDIENIPGVPKRPISLPIQNVVAASSVMSTTREQSNIVRKQLISQSSVNGPNAAFVSVSSSMIPVTREQSVKVSKQFVSQISVSDSDAVHSSSSKVYGPSPRLHLNLDLNTVNVPKHVRKQVLLHPGFSEMGPSVEEVDPSVPLEKQGWYHGSIRRIDAEKLLRVLKEGSYLVRNSESSKQDFSLSLKSARGFMHMKIVCNDGKFILGQFSKPFDSIPEIISYYSLHKLPIKGAEYMSLRHPVIDQLL